MATAKAWVERVEYEDYVEYREVPVDKIIEASLPMDLSAVGDNLNTDLALEPPPWWPVMIYDDLWWSTMIHDDIWWCMRIYDDLWWFIMIHDDLWRYMMIYDYPWWSINDSWWPMMIYDDLWYFACFTYFNDFRRRFCCHISYWLDFRFIQTQCCVSSSGFSVEVLLLPICSWGSRDWVQDQTGRPDRATDLHPGRLKWVWGCVHKLP